MASPGVQSTVQQAGEINYLAADVKEHQTRLLQELRDAPYDPGELAARFSHGMNAHLPASIPTRVDPDRYYKDPESKLVIDRVPGVTPDQLQTLVELLRRMAPQTVAYDMKQITGYIGKEPPMQISLDTTARIFAPARRNWGGVELGDH